MADNSKIEWTEATWNPITGCTKVSPGCDHCYAMGMARRIEAMQNAQPFRDKPSDYEGTTRHEYDAAGKLLPVDWTGRVNLLPDRLDWPIRKTKPLRIFVNSMSDLFHEQVPDEYIARIWAVMVVAKHHTFQVLTKRHGRMRSLLNNLGFYVQVRTILEDEHGWSADDASYFNFPPKNVWVGVSVENQKWADIRVPALLDTPARVRWLSMEPLLGPVTFSYRQWAPRGYPQSSRYESLKGIGWIVLGGESGTDARLMHPQWARTIRDQCAEAGIPFLFKQWGAWAPHRLDGGHVANVRVSKTRDQYESTRINPHGEAYVASEPDHPRRGYSSPGMTTMLRVGKHGAGRELDGRTWDEYPKEAI